MFHHVVLMQLTDADAVFHARVAASVARVRAEVAGLVSFSFGPNRADRGRGYDWAVIGLFAGAADHDAYQVSPAHVALKAIMNPHITEMVVCDVETTEAA